MLVNFLNAPYVKRICLGLVKMNQKEIKALQRKLDKKSLQLMGRYEKLRTIHGKLLRLAIKKKTSRDWNKTFHASSVARRQMEMAHAQLQSHLRKSGNNRRRLK